MGDAVVHRVVEGGAPVGGHIVDAVDEQAGVVGVVAHLLDHRVKGQHLCLVPHVVVEVVDKLGHHRLNLAHIGGGDAVALVGHQGDVQPRVALQGGDRLDLTGQVLAPLHPLVDGEGAAGEAGDIVPALGVLHPEVGPHHRVLTYIGGHQGDGSRVKVGGGVVSGLTEGHLLQSKREGEIPGLVADVGVLAGVGDQGSAVLLDLDRLDGPRLPVLGDGHLLRRQLHPRRAGDLDGDHREGGGIHLLDLRGVLAQGQQVLEPVVAFAPLVQGQAGEKLPGLVHLSQAQVGLTQPQGGGRVLRPGVQSLLIGLGGRLIVPGLQRLGTLVQGLLIGVGAGDHPPAEKHAGRHQNHRQGGDEWDGHPAPLPGRTGRLLDGQDRRSRGLGRRDDSRLLRGRRGVIRRCVVQQGEGTPLLRGRIRSLGYGGVRRRIKGGCRLLLHPDHRLAASGAEPGSVRHGMAALTAKHKASLLSNHRTDTAGRYSVLKGSA